MIIADEQEIETARQRLTEEFGKPAEALEADLATTEGVDELQRTIKNRPVAALLANAGRELGDGFLDQDFDEVRRVVDTNITGTIDLIHRVAKDMRKRGEGRILTTGSIAGFIPDSFQAVYSATKAFIDSFSLALRNELKDTGVTVTCLMPGATETEFFARANMLSCMGGGIKCKSRPPGWRQRPPWHNCTANKQSQDQLNTESPHSTYRSQNGPADHPSSG